jgi:hypothetical protein
MTPIEIAVALQETATLPIGAQRTMSGTGAVPL